MSGSTELEVKPLSDEQFTKIYEKVQNEGSKEADYFLKISIERNSCSTPVYKTDFVVQIGDAKVIEIGQFEDSCRRLEDYIVIPQSTQVIVMMYEQDEETRVTDIYAFDFTTGWKHMRL